MAHDTTTDVPLPIETVPPATLKRELGRWDLTAIGINQVIGSGVFALPAALAASAGAWSPWMVAAVGFASMLIALSFAEVASRFEGTGGPYLYTRAAFGRFAAFEVGWMLWFTRAASWAAVITVLIAALGRYWPRVTSGAPKIVLLTSIVAVLAAINIRGIRQSSFVVNALTVGKLLPLVVFIVVGLFYVDASRLTADASVPLASLSASGLLLIFAFGGYEVVPVVAGETRDPRRTVPFALIMTIVIVTIVMTMAQVVALGTLPGLAESKTPLADAAAVFLGTAGAAMLTLGAVFSTSGNNMGQALSGSRNLFALAEQGDLPPFFGRVHPTYRTPINAILVTAAVALVLALSGTFQALAAASAISRLVVYVATCASTLRLRRVRGVNPPIFTVPFGPVIPVAAILFALAILAGASRLQLMSGTGALAAGAVLYLIAVKGAAGPPTCPGSRSRSRLMFNRIVLLAALVLSFPVQAAAQSSVFVVRHAERTDTGTGVTPPPGADPDLSAAGHLRAASLAAMLKDAGITAIYATQYKRTHQTAAPLAAALGVTVVTIPSADTAQLVARLKAAPGNVLVVGHSNTVPDVIKGLGVDAPVTVAESEFDNLFIVTRAEKPSAVRLRYK